MTIKEMENHPHLVATDETGKKVRITVCAECEALSSVLFLTKDRWICTNCRSEGTAAPERIHLDNPVRRSRNG